MDGGWTAYFKTSEQSLHLLTAQSFTLEFSLSLRDLASCSEQTQKHVQLIKPESESKHGQKQKR